MKRALAGNWGIVLSLLLTACQGSGLERSLAPDPKLTAPSPTLPAKPSPTPTPTDTPTPEEVTYPEPSPTPVVANVTAVPPALQPLVQEVLNLGVIPASEVQLEQPATRRQFARWLMAVQQRLYQDQIERQVRPATPGSPPVFADVPRSDPDFPAIQGLAEAGIIPSRLSSPTAATRFQPDQPLTRAALITWKVSLDVPDTLPTATTADVAKTWGFQDAATLDPLALAALSADYGHEPSTVRRVWGRTRLFLPTKPVSQAQALAALWSLGNGDTLVTAREALK